MEGTLHWLLKKGMLVRNFSFPLPRCLSHFLSLSKIYFESFHLMVFPLDPGVLLDYYNITKNHCPHYPTCFWRQWVYQANKEVSSEVIILKYVPSCCRKLLRRVLFTLLPLPQQHLYQIVALFPPGSALEKAVFSIKVPAPLLSAARWAQGPKNQLHPAGAAPWDLYAAVLQ